MIDVTSKMQKAVNSSSNAKGKQSGMNSKARVHAAAGMGLRSHELQVNIQLL